VQSAVTDRVRVSVEAKFSPERSNVSRGLWFFLYNIVIKNEGPETVQLVSRHWIITDAHGEEEEVRGPGVVGQQPTLREGEAFAYTSGCPLKTPFGSMRGTYQMTSSAGRAFEITIPAFVLRDPKKMQ
jgi:ApaG protein